MVQIEYRVPVPAVRSEKSTGNGTEMALKPQIGTGTFLSFNDQKRNFSLKKQKKSRHFWFHQFRVSVKIRFLLHAATKMIKKII